MRLVPGKRTAQGFERFDRSAKLGMIWRWANSDGCRTRTGLPGCAPWQQCVACSAIRRRGSSCRCGAEKNALGRGGPIWLGGKDRSEASLDEFFTWLGPKKSRRIQLAVMDMWKAFRNSTKRHAPQANILFDKFHVMRHLGDALDPVRN